MKNKIKVQKSKLRDDWSPKHHNPILPPSINKPDNSRSRARCYLLGVGCGWLWVWECRLGVGDERRARVGGVESAVTDIGGEKFKLNCGTYPALSCVSEWDRVSGVTQLSWGGSLWEVASWSAWLRACGVLSSAHLISRWNVKEEKKTGSRAVLKSKQPRESEWGAGAGWSMRATPIVVGHDAFCLQDRLSPPPFPSLSLSLSPFLFLHLGNCSFFPSSWALKTRGSPTFWGVLPSRSTNPSSLLKARVAHWITFKYVLKCILIIYLLLLVYLRKNYLIFLKIKKF